MQLPPATPTVGLREMFERSARVSSGGARTLSLVVSFPLQPAAWTPAQDVATRLVVDEYGSAERHRRDPPSPAEWIHAKASVQPGAVGHEGGQRRLKEQPKDHLMIHHALVNNGVAASFTDDQVSPLNDDN